MSRDRSGEPLLGTRVSLSFASAVESAAVAHGVSKSALVRRALVSYLLPDGRDA